MLLCRAVRCRSWIQSLLLPLCSYVALLLPYKSFRREKIGLIRTHSMDPSRNANQCTILSVLPCRAAKSDSIFVTYFRLTGWLVGIGSRSSSLVDTTTTFVGRTTHHPSRETFSVLHSSIHRHCPSPFINTGHLRGEIPGRKSCIM